MKEHQRRCSINIRPIWNCQNSQSAPWMRGIKNKKKELLITESYEYTCDWAAYLWLRGNDCRVPPPLPPSHLTATATEQVTRMRSGHSYQEPITLERENSHTADFKHSVFYRPDLKFRAHFFPRKGSSTPCSVIIRKYQRENKITATTTTTTTTKTAPFSSQAEK